jgi:hypothetical protein
MDDDDDHDPPSRPVDQGHDSVVPSNRCSAWPTRRSEIWRGGLNGWTFRACGQGIFEP